jgi:microcystin-dependent protein
MDPFIAEIKIFAGNFAPRAWAFCDGQLLPISQNSALFSLLGTTYGGDGRTTFGLPDLRGRTPIGPRNGPGLSDYALGQRGGAEHIQLNSAQMPSHNHLIRAVTTGGTSTTPTDNLLADSAAFDNEFSDATANTNMSSAMVSSAGGNLAHENRQPFLALNYIICIQGVFPSRS